MRTKLFATLGMLVAVLGCAEDDPGAPTADLAGGASAAETATIPAASVTTDVTAEPGSALPSASVVTPAAAPADAPAVAFLGVTVMDCQSEATRCFQDAQGAMPAECTSKLTACLGSIEVHDVGASTAAAIDTITCGTDGLSCVLEARSLSDVLACQGEVEGCVVDHVKAATGITLPTPTDLIKAAVDVLEEPLDAVGDVVEEVAMAGGKVIRATIDATGKVIDATGKVIGATVDATGKVLDATGKVVGEVVKTGATIVGDTAHAAGDLVSGTLQTGGKILGEVTGGLTSLLECSAESQQCWRKTRDYGSCSKQYDACLAR